jgi:transcriptional regulator with XRE-family HTH domain
MLMQALRAPISEQLRSWRERRQLSQLELSLAADVSARHLSFVENGRALTGDPILEELYRDASSYPHQGTEDAQNEASADGPAIAFEVITRLGSLIVLERHDSFWLARRCYT